METVTLAVEKLETILVVEDMEEVLQLCVFILESANFVVLKATGGDHAIKVAANHDGNIDLLLSDVNMPGMSGPSLAETLRKARPHMQVMLMSGYTGEELSVLDPGWALLRKPFMPTKLVEMVNRVLHAPNKSGGSRSQDGPEAKTRRA